MNDTSCSRCFRLLLTNRNAIIAPMAIARNINIPITIPAITPAFVPALASESGAKEPEDRETVVVVVVEVAVGRVPFDGRGKMYWVYNPLEL